MTVKEQHVLNYWWNSLERCARQMGRPVTAGELATNTGQSRNTAKKHLERMVKEKGAIREKVPHWNGTKKAVYRVLTGEERDNR